MQDERKTKTELVRELRTLKAKLKRLEKSDDDAIGGVQIISHDISESKLAERAIMQSEERLRKNERMLKNAERVAQFGCYEIDVHTGKAIWSDETFRIFGLDPSIGEPTVDTYRKLIHQEDAATMFQLFDECIKDQKRFDMEYRILHSSGDIRYVHSLGDVETNAEGAVVKMFGTLQDITERKRGEDALSRAEEHYRTLYNAIDEGFCIIEVIFDENEKPIDYRFLEINPSFEKQTGLIDAQGKSMRELAPKHEEHWFEIYGKIAVTGEPFRFVNRAEQLHRWYDVYAFRVGQPEKRQVAILFNDITERVRAEDALKEANAKLTRAQRIAHIGNWSDHLPTNRLDWSEEMYHIFALPPNTPVNLAEVISVFPTEELERFQKAIGEAINDDVPYSMDYRIVRPDGAVRYIHDEGEIVRDEQGKAIWMHGTTQDITERKRAEASIIQALEWQEAIFEGSRDAVFISDQDSRLVAINKAAIELTGYSREQLLTMRIPDLHDQRDLDAYETYHQRIFGGEDILSEAKILRSDGVKVDTEFNNRCVWIEGKPYMHTTARDITERKRAEEVLSKTRDDLKRTLDLVPDMICTASPDGFFLKVNPAFTNTLGYSQEQLLATSYLDLIHPDDRESTMVEVERQLAGQPTVNFENRYRCKNGTYKVLEWNATRAYSGVLFAVARDITERKRGEEALGESLERFELANRATFNTIWDWNLQTDALWWNDNLQLMFGHKPEEIEPGIESWANRIHPEDLSRINIGIHAAIDSGKQSWSDQYRFRRKDGSYAIVADRGYISRDTSGKPMRMIGAMEDITERKRAEQRIEEERNLLRSIINAIPDEIVVKDLERKFVLANEGCLRALGKNTMDEVVGLRDEDLVPEPFVRDAREKEIHVLTSGETLLNDMPEPRRNPTTGELERAIMSTKTPLHDPSGRLVGLVVVNRDITNLHRTQETLSQSETRFRTVWDHSLDANRLTDAEGTIVMVNQSYCQLFKKESEELVGRSLADTYLPKPDENIVGDYCERFRNRTIAPFLEAGVTTWNGEALWLELSNSFLFVPNQQELLLTVFRDITKRKRAEIQVRYQANLLSNVTDAILATDREFNIQYWNTAAEKLYGWKLSEVSGGHFTKFIQPQYIGDSRRTVMRKIMQEGSWNGELFHNRRDGALFPVQVTISEVRDNEGEIIGHIAVNRDITERKQAEEALRESEVRFRELFNRMSSGVAVYEAIDSGGDFIFRDFNPAAERIEKVSRKDILGKRVSEAFPGVKEFGVFEVFQRVWQTGKPEYFPESIYKDERDPGSWRENSVFKLPTGEIVSIYNDITERKRAEESLRKQDERYKRVIENIFTFIPEGILVFTDTLRLFNRNKTFDDIVRMYSAKLGYTEQELTELIFGEVKNKLAGEAGATIRIPKKKNEEREHRTDHSIKDP